MNAKKYQKIVKVRRMLLRHNENLLDRRPKHIAHLKAVYVYCYSDFKNWNLKDNWINLFN